MHPISAFPSRSRLLEKMHFHSRLSSHTRSRRCGRIQIAKVCLSVRLAICAGRLWVGNREGEERMEVGEGWFISLGREDFTSGVSSAGWTSRWKAGGVCWTVQGRVAEVLIGMYIIFSRFTTVSRHCSYPLPFANTKLVRNTYDRRLRLRSNTLFPMVH